MYLLVFFTSYIYSIIFSLNFLTLKPIQTFSIIQTLFSPFNQNSRFFNFYQSNNQKTQHLLCSSLSISFFIVFQLRKLFQCLSEKPSDAKPKKKNEKHCSPIIHGTQKDSLPVPFHDTLRWNYWFSNPTKRLFLS